MSNRLDMKKDTNNLKDKTKCDGPEKPDSWAMTSNGFSGHWFLHLLICVLLQSHSFSL